MSGESQVNVALTASVSGLIDGLGKATSAVKSSTDQMSGMFGGLGHAIENLKAPFAALAGVLAGGKLFHDAIHGATDWAGQVGGLARQLGITTTAASGLAVALHSIGMDAEAYRAAVFKVQMALKSQEDQLNANGVATRNSKNEHLSIQEVMQNGVKRLQEMKEGYDRNALSQLMFGRSAMEMQGLVRLTSERIAESTERARQLGLVMTTEGVSAARSYKESLAEVGLVTEAIQVRVGSELLPRLTQLGLWFAEEGPKIVGPIASAMGALADVLSSTTAKIAGIGALLAGPFRGMLVAAGTAVVAFVQTLQVQMALAAMEGVTGIGALTGALTTMINPWLVAAVAIGGAAYALERWSERNERAAASAIKASQAARGSYGEYDELAARLKQIDANVKDSTATAEEKKQADEQMHATIEQLVAISPSFHDALTYEADGHLNVAETLKRANEQRREALRLQAADLAQAKARLEAQKAEILEASRAGRNAIAREQDPTLGETDLGPSPSALKRAAELDEKIRSVAKEAAAVDAAIAGPVKPKGGASFVSKSDTDAADEEQKQADAHRAFLDKLRTEMLEGEDKIYAEWRQKYDEVWAKSDERTQQQYDEEIAAVDRFMQRKLDLYRGDRAVDDLREQLAGAKNNGEMRLAIQREIIAREVAMHGEGSEKVLAERRKLAQMTVEVDQEGARLRLQIANAERSREVSLIDEEAQGIAHRRALGQITAQQEIEQLRVLEDRKFALRLQSVQAEQQIEGLTIEERRRLLDQEQALYVEHYRAIGELARRSERERLDEVKGYVGPTVAAATSGLAGIVQGTQSAGDAIKSVWQSILSTVLNVINRMVTEWIAAKVTMSMPGLFGGGGGGGGTAIPASSSGLLEMTGAQLPAGAAGGSVRAGETWMVGEEGPEPFVTADGRAMIIGTKGPGLFRAPAAGTIFPNHALSAASVRALTGAAARGSGFQMPSVALPAGLLSAPQRFAGASVERPAAALGDTYTVDVHLTVPSISPGDTLTHLRNNRRQYRDLFRDLLYKGEL